MTKGFNLNPVRRFAGPCEPIKRPKEFTCFSYDDQHKLHLDDRSLKWYYPPIVLGTDLSNGFETFDKHDDSQDEHLDSLLEAIMNHEKETGQPIDAHVVTWRGMMTKFMAAPFEDRDGFEMNATLYRDCIFIEENHAYKVASRKEQDAQPWKGPIPQEVMQYWGYKFETLATLPAPWGETSRDYIENRDNEVVNNKEQYCSVVRTGIGKTILCLGGEVDALWDIKPREKGKPINWVELKTSAEIRSDRDMDNFERKLMKFWIQSFLLGVPKIIVGFRSRDGRLLKLEELETVNIPDTVKRRGRAGWDGNVCINAASAFLEWLRGVINDEGVWRIRRKPHSPIIEVWKVEETGHGKILTDDFINWRIKLALSQTATA
ncbi:Dhp1-interacting protein Din1 [Coniochaeta ligniaria NRRL 30616]|uniref:Decapping nuclease n=1 Tax=Coniochaeta ligniaria NRRL 30616 TaxID=1408157 RepID=A0A1J7J8N5_9PEZI|nr:Dhp1-interacting protein Din1 [Coniochaeta ligniaria NRRL 30616]